jgi:glycosyltransferase 2 family protein
MSRAVWRWARVAGAAVTLTVLVWRLGTGPFVDGVRTIDGEALAAAAGIAALTTVSCAWRWKIVAGALEVDLSLRAAVAAYYRSLFLNVTLPGGIIGDVHRGISHGRDVSDVGRGLGAVAWERAAGQVVQAVLTVAVLLALPSPVQSYMPLVAAALVAAAFGAVLVSRARTGIRDRLLAPRAWLGIAVASALVVGGHAATFLIAARTAGVSAPASQLLPLALLAMLAMVLPSVGGWGPREGVTAWVFAAAGLGAERGVATAVVYGVMVFVAALPGAAFLLMGWLRHLRLPRRTEPRLPDGAARA